jgi:FkbM family methyltransferase
MTELVPRRISYAQNGEDVRIWRAFQQAGGQSGRVYVDVGANEPRHLSISASLHDEGWRGLLIEADPELAADLRVHRPGDTVVECAAAAGPGTLTFYRVLGTGLGTLDAAEAETARARGFDVEQIDVPTRSLDGILDEHELPAIHAMTIDVEGAEAIVLQGLSFTRHRPWVLCIEAVLPGTTTPSHAQWEPALLVSDYTFVAFDGVNRWYVANEHADLADALAVPVNAIDMGEHGWVASDLATERDHRERSVARRAWQRELILNDIRGEVPREEYERQIAELRAALVSVEGSCTWRYARKVAGAAKRVRHLGRRAMQQLPGPAARALVRQRHLRHVTINMGHLTPPAFLTTDPRNASIPSPQPAVWIKPDGLPAAPAVSMSAPTSEDISAIREWLATGPFDTDDLLVRRADNHGDELGRAMAAMRTRMRLADAPNPHWAGGHLVLLDARCLQTAAFGTRGIGRFARATLLAAREAVGDERLVLLVDRGLEELPEELAGSCRQIARVSERIVSSFSVLIEPSPMTHSPEPLIPMLHSDAFKLAVMFDLIPLHYPDVYLRDVAARVEYAAALDALQRYDDVISISQTTRVEAGTLLGRPDVGVVAWPADVLLAGDLEQTHLLDSAGPIVVMTGDDARKNTYGALAAIGAATVDQARDVVVIGMAGQATRVHHWSIAAAMRPGETRTVERISDAEMATLLRSASLVVVPSFDEGLSLPVIEALRAGVPIVASDIPAHRELIGKGGYLADPRKPRDLEAAIRRTRGSSSRQRRQARVLAQHKHAPLEAVIAQRLATHAKTAVVEPAPAPAYVGGRPLDIAVAGPWPPQRSGVADYTRATIDELARLARVTVYTTADAGSDGAAGVTFAPLDQLLNEIGATGRHSHDVLVSIVGNSHFHVPFIELLQHTDAVTITHDTRLVELYLSLLGPGGAEQVMLRGTVKRVLHPPIDEQVDDMRLLQSTAFWEVARRSQMLIAHTPVGAPRMAEETHTPITLLPFANYRRPDVEHITAHMRADARQRLGFADDVIHLGSFGFIDVRTKCSDVVIEAAAWLQQWGHRVALHLVGSATAPVAEALNQQARDAGLENFEITGYVSDETLRDYSLAVDLGVQLRISPLLGVSGPLSDLAAYGTPAVASRGLAEDVDAPVFVDRLPDDVSPVQVAEAIEQRIANPWSANELEKVRVDYLDRKSPARYAQALHDLLLQVASHPVADLTNDRQVS